MSGSARFWDEIANKYYNKPISDLEAYNFKIQKTQEYLNSSMDVLELGCGTGGTALIHAPYVKSILATDISSVMLEKASERDEYKNVDNVKFEQLDIETMKLPRHYDAILAMSVLHLTCNPKKTINEIYNSLNSGGVFISSAPCLSDFADFFKWVFPIGQFFGFIPKPISFFSAAGLEKMLRNEGFSIEYLWQHGEENQKSSKPIFIIAKK